ncbi:hypothetical protein ON010_g7287 [Phytophthora cinnamomi]|nr:hypothetical protein ON010_g7287 [Phytophthora cinnamomi]
MKLTPTTTERSDGVTPVTALVSAIPIAPGHDTTIPRTAAAVRKVPVTAATVPALPEPASPAPQAAVPEIPITETPIPTAMDAATVPKISAYLVIADHGISARATAGYITAVRIEAARIVSARMAAATRFTASHLPPTSGQCSLYSQCYGLASSPGYGVIVVNDANDNDDADCQR